MSTQYLKRKNRKTTYCWFLFLVIVIFLSGCATSSLFSPYPTQIAEIKADIEKGELDKPLKTLDKRRNSADNTLYMLERGRIGQLKGDPEVSIKDFALVMKEETEADESAKISVSNTLSKGAALVSSDNAIPYRAASYERVMSHHYQAINYLMQHDIEGAGVEVRRAALEQRAAQERHAKEIAKAEEEARAKKYNPSKHESVVDQHFSAMYAAAGNVKNSFQNAYTFYLSGVIYELLGEPNDAYIDYKKALEIFPDNSFIQKDLLRLSQELGFKEDFELFSDKFKLKLEDAEAGQGELVVFYEEGYVPVKESIGIPLAATNNIHVVAFPVYRDLSSNAGKLVMSNKSGVLAETSLICDFRSLAIKDLQEKMLGIVVRQVLRLIAKNQMRKTAGNQFGVAGELAAILFNVVSEQADRRSWLTLPRNAQILRVRLPAGKQMLNLRAGNGEQDQISVDIREHKISVLHVVATRKQLFSRVL